MEALESIRITFCRKKVLRFYSGKLNQNAAHHPLIEAYVKLDRTINLGSRILMLNEYHNELSLAVYRRLIIRINDEHGRQSTATDPAFMHIQHFKRIISELKATEQRLDDRDRQRVARRRALSAQMPRRNRRIR